MKTKTYYIKKQPKEKPITIQKFAETHDLTMEIRERGPEWKQESSRFYAYFERSEISIGIFLIGTFGNGATPKEAIQNYAREISGKKIVIDAYTKNRREIQVPELKT